MKVAVPEMPESLQREGAERGADMSVSDAIRYLKQCVMPYYPLAVATLVNVCRNRRAPSSAKVAAARELLNQGIGKPQMRQLLGATPARSGVLLIPTGEGREEWEKRSSEHHEKMLASQETTGAVSSLPRPATLAST